MIHRWPSLTSGEVKIGVASRPLNAFSEVFPPQQTIYLHDLTKRDMALYVGEKLVLSSVSKVIVEKAQVIFFWAALVVKDAREQIVNGNDLECLIRQVNQLPEQINDLFAHILRSLTPKDRRRAYQVLARCFVTSSNPPGPKWVATGHFDSMGASAMEGSQQFSYQELFTTYYYKDKAKLQAREQEINEDEPQFLPLSENRTSGHETANGGIDGALELLNKRSIQPKLFAHVVIVRFASTLVFGKYMIPRVLP